MLDVPRAWPALTGLYLVMAPGTRTENRNHFQLAPLWLRREMGIRQEINRKKDW